MPNDQARIGRTYCSTLETWQVRNVYHDERKRMRGLQSGSPAYTAARNLATEAYAELARRNALYEETLP